MARRGRITGKDNSPGSGHVSGSSHKVKAAPGSRRRGTGQRAGSCHRVKARPGRRSGSTGQRAGSSQTVKALPGSRSRGTGQRDGSSHNVKARPEHDGGKSGADMGKQAGNSGQTIATPGVPAAVFASRCWSTFLTQSSTVSPCLARRMAGVPCSTN